MPRVATENGHRAILVHVLGKDGRGGYQIIPEAEQKQLLGSGRSVMLALTTRASCTTCRYFAGDLLLHYSLLGSAATGEAILD